MKKARVQAEPHLLLGHVPQEQEMGAGCAEL